MQLTNAVSLEGYLQKQTPSVFKIFQKRYFTYRNKGQFLVWFKKKPMSIDDHPKGIIKMAQIQSVQADKVDKRIFTIKYAQRNFILKAENQQMRDKWTLSLDVILQNYKNTARNKKAELSNQQKAKNWKWQQVKGQISQKIRLQNQKIILHDIQDSNQQQMTSNLLKSVFGKQILVEYQKNIIYSFFKKKSFITSELKWYIICTEFNLTEQADDKINFKMKPFLEQIQKEKKNTSNNIKLPQSDSDSSNEEVMRDDGVQINVLYEYDVKTLSVSQKILFHDIIQWSEDTSESPFSLTIKYVVPKHPDKQMSYDYQEQQKEMILQSNLMSEVKKWNLAIKIIYEKYSIKKIREQLAEERFQKYQIKMVKLNNQNQWRVLGTNNKPQYLYLNRESFKLSGFTYKLEDVIGSIKTAKIQVVVKDKGEQVSQQAPVTTITLRQQQKLLIILANGDLQKGFRKKIKKLIKKLQSALKKQQNGNINTQVKAQINLSTYHIDKKLKQTSSSIKINFYQMMERDVSTFKQQKPPKKQSLWDNFLGIFCGPPKDEEQLY